VIISGSWDGVFSIKSMLRAVYPRNCLSTPGTCKRFIYLS